MKSHRPAKLQHSPTTNNHLDPISGKPYVHVYKRTAGRAHITNNGPGCWCKPKVDLQKSNLLLHQTA